MDNLDEIISQISLKLIEDEGFEGLADLVVQVKKLREIE